MADSLADSLSSPQTIQVKVLLSDGPRSAVERCLSLAKGSTVADALRAVGCEPSGSEAQTSQRAFGVWGDLVSVDTALKQGDRVEVYRRLIVDPKVARRERFARQGARATGLFARKRPGAKPGY